MVGENQRITLQIPAQRSVADINMADLAEQLPEQNTSSKWLSECESEIDRLGRNNADPFMQAFYKRLLPELQNDPQMAAMFEAYPEFHEEATPGMAANQIFRAFQHRKIPPLYNIPHPLLSRLMDPNYPLGYDTAKGWDRDFITVASDAEEASHVEQKFLYRPIQSNIPVRGGVLLAAARMFGLKNLRIYEGGHSMGLVMTMMALKEPGRFEYPTVSVVERNSDDPHDYTKFPMRSRALNRLLRDPELQVDQAYGVDLFPGRDITEIDWARSCSYRPHEFLNRTRRSLIERLIRADFPVLNHIQDDFGLPSHLDRLYTWHPELQTQKPNLGIFSFSLYQANEAERKQALENIETILEPEEGVALAFDFMKMTPDGEMTFAKKWRDWDGNVYAKDMANKEAGWQHLFGVREGRAREVTLGSAVGELTVGALRK